MRVPHGIPAFLSHIHTQSELVTSTLHYCQNHRRTQTLVYMFGCNSTLQSAMEVAAVSPLPICNVGGSAGIAQGGTSLLPSFSSKQQLLHLNHSN